jgi:hypothetical protein
MFPYEIQEKIINFAFTNEISLVNFSMSCESSRNVVFYCLHKKLQDHQKPENINIISYHDNLINNFCMRCKIFTERKFGFNREFNVCSDCDPYFKKINRAQAKKEYKIDCKLFNDLYFKVYCNGPRSTIRIYLDIDVRHKAFQWIPDLQKILDKSAMIKQKKKDNNILKEKRQSDLVSALSQETGAPVELVAETISRWPVTMKYIDTGIPRSIKKFDELYKHWKFSFIEIYEAQLLSEKLKNECKNKIMVL